MSRVKGWLSGLVLLAVLFAPLAVSAAPTTVASSPALAQEGGQVLNLPGLDGEVTVRWDEMGVPHIYATTLHDLIMAQGFVHAADRWWQMELFRAQGSGRLSEIAGSAMVQTDIFQNPSGTPDDTLNRVFCHINRQISLLFN